MSDRKVRVSCTAIVRLTIEVQSDGAWGGECGVAQVDAQARENVRAKLSNRGLGQEGVNWKIVGDPVIVSIVSKVEER